MCNRPIEADNLIFCHGGTAFRKRGDWEGVWEGEGRSRRRLEEDLVRHAGVFIFVAATLTNVLRGFLVSKWVIEFGAKACRWTDVRNKSVFVEGIAGWGKQHPGGAVGQIFHRGGHTNTFRSHW